MLWECLAAGGSCAIYNRGHHEEGKLFGYIESNFQDISQEVKAQLQMGLFGL